MSEEQPKNLLHGITLKAMVTQLVDHYGWSGLASKIKANCFANKPSITSSLKMLRKAPWAREKVERLYIRTFINKQQPGKGRRK